MNRRDLLKQMALLGAGSLLGSVANAVLSGADLHRSPTVIPFNPQQRTLMTQLAERIIPSTDTPGAIAAGVPAFIERMVSVWYGGHERRIFCGGLDSYDAYCRTQFQRAAVACSPAQQDQALRYFEEEAVRYAQTKSAGASPFSAAEDADTPFFAKLKELTVIGYYTSEIGATQELRYEAMPMRYDGEVEFKSTDRAWSVGGLVK